MRYLFLLLLLGSFTVVWAQPNKVNTTILDSVTVFLDGAQVQRHAQLNLAKGRNEFEIMQLSPHIDPSSISITLQRPHVLQGVSFRQEFIDKASIEESIELYVDQIIEIKVKMRFLLDDQLVLQHLENMLVKNIAIGGEQVGVSTAELSKAFDFHRRELSEIKKRLADIQMQYQGMAADTLDLHREIKSLGNRKDLFTGVIVLVVDAMSTGLAQVDMSYFAAGASWFPSYDMRAGDVSQPIELTFKANISQHTGEKWENTRVTLATGSPSNSINPPTIVPWRLSRYGNTQQYNGYAGVQANNSGASFSGTPYNMLSGGEVSLRIVDGSTGEGLPGATAQVNGTTIGAVTDIDGRARLILPPNTNQIKVSYIGYNEQLLQVTNRDVVVRMGESINTLDAIVVTGYGKQGLLSRVPGVSLKGSRSNSASYYIDGIKAGGEVLAAQQSQTNTGSSYKIKELFTLPSDGKSYMAELSRIDIDASFKHYCVPRIDPAVYVLAVVTDWEQFGLLDGQANVYYENTYVGQTLVQSTSTNDTLELALGRDRLITVERKLAKDKSSRGTFNGRRSVNRTWELTANSQRNTPITLEIVEQYPISAEKGIEVELNETSGAANNPELGTLTWKIPLAIGQREKRTVAYKVIAPRGVAFQL
jgi:Domain of unknown function (DUF4139)/N-terminal domain of unknown function (DUF4140)